MTKGLWYAVSRKGQGRIFTTCPVRDDHFGIWLGESIGCITTVVMLFESDGLELPPLKWDDEPRKIELSIKV